MAVNGGLRAQAVLLMVAACALALTVVCGALLRVEYPAALLGRAGPVARIEVMLAADPRPALSLRGQRAQLEACDQALRGPFAALQSVDRRALLADRCETLATALLARAPTLGLAHLVRAEVALARGDRVAFAALLALAQAAAPAEGWQALRRADLALPHLSALPPAAAAALRADLSLLIAAPRYRAFVAARYRAQPDARPLIVAVAETAPPQAQRALLEALRQTGRGAP